MRKAIVSVAAVLALGAGAAWAQQPPVPFEQAVYTTCLEAEAMDRAPRVALVLSLAEHAGNHFGVRFRDEDKLDRELAAMIRAGCTMFPNATVFFIVSAAVKAEAEKLRGATGR
jgi:hypothetical protein